MDYFFGLGCISDKRLIIHQKKAAKSSGFVRIDE